MGSNWEFWVGQMANRLRRGGYHGNALRAGERERDVNRITHPFTTRDAWLDLRRKNLNSTEIAALFGLSPYQTSLELALTKAGKIPEADVGSERTAWGQRLQDSIAEGVFEEHGIDGIALTEYVVIDGLRIGSSFDFEIHGPLANAEKYGALSDYAQNFGPGVLEVKNVDGRIFANDWELRDGQLEAAPHIEIQLQHQLLVSGLKWGAIAVLVNGNRLYVCIRMADEYFAQRILDAAAKFWADLDAGLYPPPQMPQDAGILAKLYSHAEPGTFYDGTGDDLLRMACERYSAAGKEATDANERQETHRAEILQIIRDCEKAVAAGWKISTWMVAPQRVEYDRDGYRGFKVTKIKTKEAK